MVSASTLTATAHTTLTKTMKTNHETIIIPENSWAAFLDLESKLVYGITEFKKGGKSHSKLDLIIKPTKAEVEAAIAVALASAT